MTADPATDTAIHAYPPPPAAGDLTVINGRILDPASGNSVDGAIRIEAGRITAVGPDVTVAGEVVDAAGGSVLPGLIDAHCHAFASTLTGAEGIPETYVGILGARRMTAALRRGFTTIRDPAGGDPAFARAGDEGLYPSPRYLYSGPPLSQTGGHSDQRPPESTGCAHPVEIVDGVDAVRQAVRDRFRRGAHAIKIMTSGGVISPSDPIAIPQYSPAEIRAIADEAERRGSYVIAHAYSAAAVRHSVLNGVRSIEHGNLIDAETAALMAEHDAFLVPTLATYDAMSRRAAGLGLAPVSQQKNAEVLAAGQDSIRLARQAGVKIGFGSDLMGELENEQLNGLRLQAEVLGVCETIEAATATNAALLQRDDLGRIATGCIGDLLVLSGDVVADPEALFDDRSPRTVIRSGSLA